MGLFPGLVLLWLDYLLCFICFSSYPSFPQGYQPISFFFFLFLHYNKYPHVLICLCGSVFTHFDFNNTYLVVFYDS